MSRDIYFRSDLRPVTKQKPIYSTVSITCDKARCNAHRARSDRGDLRKRRLDQRRRRAAMPRPIASRPTLPGAGTKPRMTKPEIDPSVKKP